MDWISVKDEPLFITTSLGWECTENGEGLFLAAVPYEDKKEPGKEFWWIQLCVVHDGVGLCVVEEDGDDNPAGWELEDITHYQRITPPQSPL